jgi:hypothetical protein
MVVGGPIMERRKYQLVISRFLLTQLDPFVKQILTMLVVNLGLLSRDLCIIRHDNIFNGLLLTDVFLALEEFIPGFLVHRDVVRLVDFLILLEFL